MSSPPPTGVPAAFICACEKWMRSACKDLPFFKEHGVKRYCVLHYPAKDKIPLFSETLKRKIEDQDLDFRGAWFPERVDFQEVTFTKPVYFTYATFNGEADFNSAMFMDKAYFSAVTFKANVTFRYATFGARATFISTTFTAGADFGRATFKDYVGFGGRGIEKVFGDNSSLELQFANIEKPDRLSFHTLTLRPNWFVNVDARKFEFINVEWEWRDVGEEISDLVTRQIAPPHRLLAITYRNLAVNAEENHRYEEASKFRYMAMEARRLESRQGWRTIVSWLLGWLYWLFSGYSERAGRAFVVLIGVWLLTAALYTQVGFVRWEPRVSSEQEAASAKRDEVGEPLRWRRALTYSLGVMTLQKPEPRPATNAAQALVMAETILGPVQAALLALAIRRKFMR